MAVHITPELMEACYEMLRRSLPFRNWKLPFPDDVGFHVTRSKDTSGKHWIDKDVHQIEVSSRKVKSLQVLTTLMAHEMCHVEQTRRGERSEHGRIFQSLATAVCKYHGFDRGDF